MSALRFEIEPGSPACGPRVGRLHLPHGTVPTPAFMPVGTLGTVKSLTPDQLAATGAAICLGNTYHLYLRPGLEVIGLHGGLHRFMGWDRPILTDSGGFQVFSLESLRTVDDDGVDFRSHLDGSRHRLTPARAIEIQEVLGADIIMCFDECPPGDAPRAVVRRAMDRTTAWARRCQQAQTRSDQALFGIVQGGIFEDLRAEHAQALVALDLPGYAIGGLSVGEGHEEMIAALRATTPHLPIEKPRYLMGVGTPLDIVEAVAAGVDMMDCVLPTRNARMATAYTAEGRLNLRNARFRTDLAPLDPACPCLACTRFTRAYICHLVRSRELLAHTLLTLHNLTHYQRLMAELRAAIPAGRLDPIIARERALEAARSQGSS